MIGLGTSKRWSIKHFYTQYYEQQHEWQNHALKIPECDGNSDEKKPKKIDKAPKKTEILLTFKSLESILDGKKWRVECQNSQSKNSIVKTQQWGWDVDSPNADTEKNECAGKCNACACISNRYLPIVIRIGQNFRANSCLFQMSWYF